MIKNHKLLIQHTRPNIIRRLFTIVYPTIANLATSRRRCHQKGTIENQLIPSSQIQRQIRRWVRRAWISINGPRAIPPERLEVWPHDIAGKSKIRAPCIYDPRKLRHVLRTPIPNRKASHIEIPVRLRSIHGHVGDLSAVLLRVDIAEIEAAVLGLVDVDGEEVWEGEVGADTVPERLIARMPG